MGDIYPRDLHGLPDHPRSLTEQESQGQLPGTHKRRGEYCFWFGSFL